MNTMRDLPVVDGLKLPAELRALLRPDEAMADRAGRSHRLPRFFYEIRSWSQAKELALTPHVRLSELLVVDCREAPRLLDEFPHFVPCAVALLGRVLEDFRGRAGAPVHVAANGGYRSPPRSTCSPTATSRAKATTTSTSTSATCGSCRRVATKPPTFEFGRP